MKQMILASGSPRRKELLGELGFDFEIIPSPAEELHDESIPLVELCELNAEAKALAVAAAYPDRVVLGADTLVYIDEAPLGKPADMDEARATLRKLSGRAHQVCTGMALVYGERVERFSVVTEVVFKELTDKVIDSYFQKVHVLDKAGSYGIQESGDMIVESIEGDYSNVVGLPQKCVAEKLNSFGVFASADL